jgi:hypothetical protein
MKKLVKAIKLLANEEYFQMGFTIRTSDDDIIEDNFDSQYDREPNEEERAILSDDIEIIERNALKYLDNILDGVRDEGHTDYGLGGTCWCRWNNKKGLETIGAHLDADPNELSSEEDTAFYKGTSDLAVVDATLDFFDVSNEDKRKLKELGYYDEDIEDEDEE